MKKWQKMMLATAVSSTLFADNADKKLLDKGFSQEWINALTAKGEKEVFTGEQLKYIGMPIGGLFCGQVYLGGDGDLWYWDIQNKRFYGPGVGGDRFYINPMTQEQFDRVDQGFSIDVKGTGEKNLSRKSDWNITFKGQYPIGTVNYTNDNYPVEVELKAYSPFSPTETDDSSIPATILEYTIKNTSDKAQTVNLKGWLQNMSAYFKGNAGMGSHRNQIVTANGITQLICDNNARKVTKTSKKDILFEDFEGGTYKNWKSEGKAFGDDPFTRTDFASHHRVTGHHGTVLVNSHNTRVAPENPKADALTGTLTSKKFKIDRNYISFVIGGGAHKGSTEFQLLIDGKVVEAAQGNNSNKMVDKSFFVEKYIGKTAQLRAVDNHTGGWGHIGVDQIVFTDNPKGTESLKELHDYGNMTLTIFDDEDVTGDVNIDGDAAEVRIGDKLVGSLTKELEIGAGDEETVKFVVSWYYPNIGTGEGAMKGLKGMDDQTHYYDKFFKSSADAAQYVAKNYDRLSSMTKEWVDTWYDSSLPNWFLDRTFLNTSTLATTVWHRFYNPKDAQLDGRAYCWEGAYLGDGSCTHVLHYEQAMGRIFPDVTSDMREKVDYGIAFDDKIGYIKYRAEYGYGHHYGFDHAVDGHAGTILRMYREYTMNSDKDFLVRNWTKVKKSIQCLIDQDTRETGKADGIIEERQYNTLDRVWHGKVPWISGLYNSVLLAGVEMAKDMNEPELAKKYADIAAKGKVSLGKLYDGEYFIQHVDPAHQGTPNSNIGCHIDQLLGEYWAEQNNLPSVFEEDKAQSALESIFKYSFLKDIGSWQKNAKVKPRRFFSLPGEAGTTMCSFPKGSSQTGTAKEGVIGGYFSEAWTGQEHAVAALMIDRGMIKEGLAIIKAVHDRYGADKRNPYNEVEYGNHYTRAMSGYAPFVSATGFKYHALKQMIGFEPKMNADNFKSAFISGEAWGSYSQKIEGDELNAKIENKFGKLSVKTIELSSPFKVSDVDVSNGGFFGGKSATFTQNGDDVVITLKNAIELEKGDKLKISLEK